MNRRTFIKKGCMSCAGIGMLGLLLPACTSVKYTSGNLGDKGLLIDLDSFDGHKDSTTPFVIVRNEQLQYPICIYKISGAEYTALWMACPHQGAELQVSGDQLTCPAHGSEFDRRGNVTQAPASMNLRSFPVTVTGKQLFIDLRKQ